MKNRIQILARAFQARVRVLPLKNGGVRIEAAVPRTYGAYFEEFGRIDAPAIYNQKGEIDSDQRYPDTQNLLECVRDRGDLVKKELYGLRISPDILTPFTRLGNTRFDLWETSVLNTCLVTIDVSNFLGLVYLQPSAQMDLMTLNTRLYTMLEGVENDLL